MLLYVSKRKASISGTVPVRRLVSFSMRYLRHLEYTDALIFSIMVRLTRLQMLNVSMVSLCWRIALDIWNCVTLGTCTSVMGSADVTGMRCPRAPPPRLDGRVFCKHGLLFVPVRGFRRWVCRGLVSELGAESSLLRWLMSLLSCF